MARPMKEPPAYAIASVDHALRLAVILQLEGPMTVSEAALRLGVARSTAHRLLSMLVYRDFAVQGADRSYRAGPVLELATQANSDLGALRTAALGPLRQLVKTQDETAQRADRGRAQRAEVGVGLGGELQDRPGPVRAVRALHGEVAVDQHGEQPVGGGPGDAKSPRSLRYRHRP